MQSAQIWRMIVTFLVVLGGLNFLYYAEKKLDLGIWDGPYTVFVTWLSGVLGQVIFPYSLRTVGNALVAGETTVVYVVSGCNGLEAIFLMVAGILAFPAAWGQRLRAMALYLPLLFVLNLFRILLLVHAAHVRTQYLDVLHYQVAQGVLIVCVLFFWFNYVRGVDPR